MPQSEPSNGFFVRLNDLSESAAEEVDRRHRKQLCDLVERELDKRFRAREDPEDVAQSALRSLYRGIDDGRFHIDSSGELWALLATIARRKILSRAEYHNAQKRSPTSEETAQVDRTPNAEPLPDEEVVAADLIEQVVAGLAPPDPEILRVRLQGYTLPEIAEQFDLTATAVRTKLRRIRDRLRRLIHENDER